jgi:hypothetical protein
MRGRRWCSWLRHCATSRKVAGSIPDGVIILPNRTGVDSVSNRNKYQEYFLSGKGGRFIRLTTLPPANCLEILVPQPPEIIKACPGL